MQRRAWVIGIVSLVLLCGLVWFWPRHRPHLIVITLDTTRADRLGCYGYTAGQTPVIDALASGGILCERGYTVAPITLPAHASLFTGLYPAENGVRRNGHGRLDDSIPALAEILQRQGYDTAGFVASFVLHRKFGLDRGFQVYDDGFWREGPPVEPEQRRRHGGAVVDAALQWLRVRTGRPFFCWVHLYDPHAPCSTHPEIFGETFAGRPYDAEIAYMDAQVGRIIEHVKSQNLLDDSLIVVVGDHGESLGEHLELSHTLTLYNAAMRVPLIFHRPAQLAGGGRVATNVSLVDVFPTIVELLGLRQTAKTNGQSIKAALSGGTSVGSLCYGATDDPFEVFGCSPLRSLTDGDWKFIRTTRPELYQLDVDPGELHNLAEVNAEQARTMESRLAELESQLAFREEVRVPLSQSERKALESLGYTGRIRSSTRAAAAAPPDIKDILPFERDMEESKNLFERGAVNDAVALLRNVLQRAPTHAPASWSLAWTLWKQKKPDEAMEVFRALIAVWPECHVAHYGLGFMHLQRDELEEAIPALLLAVKADPENADAQLHLAECLFCAGRTEDAQAHLNRALRADPAHFEANQLRTYMTSSRGHADAPARYREAMRQASRAAEAADFREMLPSGH